MKKSLIYLIVAIFTVNISATSVFAKDIGNDTPTDLDIMVGQMVMVGFKGTTLTEYHHLREDLLNHHLGGVILFGSKRKWRNNIENHKQLKTLISDIKKLSTCNLLIAIDEEGGKVSRLNTAKGFPPSLSQKKLGQLNDPTKTLTEAYSRAKLLRTLGINLNLAPVVDLAVNKNNKVIYKAGRSFSSDPRVVTSHASRVIKGHQMAGVLSALKHFPGHGSSLNDSHKGFTDITNTWTKDELFPYLHLINDGFDEVVMTAHVFNAKLDDTYPATLSKKILTGKLRDELKFNGVIISDDMQMKAISDNYKFSEAITLAINSGVDIILIANMIEYDEFAVKKAVSVIKSLVLKGLITEERIKESYERIKKLKGKTYEN